jgi:hypothetical protein
MRLLQHLLCGGPALAATGADPEATFETAQRANALLRTGADVAFGDAVAKADIHKVMRSIIIQSLIECKYVSSHFFIRLCLYVIHVLTSFLRIIIILKW